MRGIRYARGMACIIIGCIAWLLSGCAGQREEIRKTADQEWRWESGEFLENEKISEEHLLYELAFEKGEGKNLEMALSLGVPKDAVPLQEKVIVAGAQVLRLGTYYNDQGSYYVLSRYFGNVAPLRLDLLDWMPEGGMITSMAGTDKDSILFGVAYDYSEECGYQGYGVFCIGENGELRWKAYLSEAIRKEKIWSEFFYAGQILDCDDEDHIYLADKDCIYVLDKEGSLLMSHQSKLPGEALRWDSFHTDDQNTIFVCSNSEQSELFWMDVKEGKTKIIKEANYSNVRKWYGMWEQKIYYASDGNVLRWDVSTGEKEVLFTKKLSGLKDIPDALLPMEDRLLVWGRDQSGDCVITYGEREQAGEG